VAVRSSILRTTLVGYGQISERPVVLEDDAIDPAPVLALAIVETANPALQGLFLHLQRAASANSSPGESASQSIILPAAPADTSLLPEASNSNETTPGSPSAWCAANAIVPSHAAVFHSRITPSRPPEANVFPSGLKARLWTEPQWPERNEISAAVAPSTIRTRLSDPPTASCRPSGEYCGNCADRYSNLPQARDGGGG